LIGNIKNINQVIIKKNYYSNAYYLNVVYTKDEKEKQEYKNIMYIDLGLDNLVTVIFLENEDTYIIDGKNLKSRRKYLKLKCIPKLIQSVMDDGIVNAPRRISVDCYKQVQILNTKLRLKLSSMQQHLGC